MSAARMREDQRRHRYARIQNMWRAVSERRLLPVQEVDDALLRMQTLDISYEGTPRREQHRAIEWYDLPAQSEDLPPDDNRPPPTAVFVPAAPPVTISDEAMWQYAKDSNSPDPQTTEEEIMDFLAWAKSPHNPRNWK